MSLRVTRSMVGMAKITKGTVEKSKAVGKETTYKRKIKSEGKKVKEGDLKNKQIKDKDETLNIDVLSEDSFVVPGIVPELRIPSRLLTRYRPEFLEGVYSCLRKDRSLAEVFVRGLFDSFVKPDQQTTPDSYDYVMGHYHKNKEENKHLLKHYFFFSLCRGLIAQQVSGFAAKAILARVQALYVKKEEKEHEEIDNHEGVINFPPALFFLSAPTSTLRDAGLSQRKTEYIVSVAEFFENDDEDVVEFILTASNDDVVARLLEIRGIGIWSVQMFLVFALKRLDVFAAGDLGVAHGISLYLKQRPDVMSQLQAETIINPKFKCHWTKGKQPAKRRWTPVHEQYMLALAEQFQPYRSVFMLFMWQLVSINIDALSK